MASELNLQEKKHVGWENKGLREEIQCAVETHNPKN